MRKHKIRHILHGLLDLLPLFVIPVFMVYSHRHEINDYTVDTTETVVTPLYETNEVSSIDDIYANHIYHYETLTPVNEGGYTIYVLSGDIVQTNIIDLDEIFIYDYNSSSDNYISISVDNTFTIYCSNANGYIGYEVQNLTLNNIDFYIDEDDIILFKQEVEINDFGLPTASDFQTYNVQVNQGVVLNDTDIGSQFLYSLYNATTKYFNTDSVFNLSSLHNWITNNFFNGNMPLGVTVVYHIIVYELIMDIIFLIYAVFMFIVDFASDFLEHCFTWSRRGGN